MLLSGVRRGSRLPTFILKSSRLVAPDDFQISVHSSVTPEKAYKVPHPRALIPNWVASRCNLTWCLAESSEDDVIGRWSFWSLNCHWSLADFLAFPRVNPNPARKETLATPKRKALSVHGAKKKINNRVIFILCDLPVNLNLESLTISRWGAGWNSFPREQPWTRWLSAHVRWISPRVTSCIFLFIFRVFFISCPPLSCVFLILNYPPNSEGHFDIIFDI